MTGVEVARTNRSLESSVSPTLWALGYSVTSEVRMTDAYKPRVRAMAPEQAAERTPSSSIRQPPLADNSDSERWGK